MKNENILWPKKGMKAFISGKNGKSFHLPSVRNWFYPQHAGAFKHAADMILDSYQASKKRYYYDELFFPVAYLYRHYLELKLKDIIWLGVFRGFFKREKKLLDILKEHHLAPLWTLVKKMLKNDWPDADLGPLQGIEAVINEYHRADRSGQTFRYDHDTNLKRHSYEHFPDHVNIQKLRDTMESIDNLLDGCESMIRDDLSNRDREH